MKNLLKTLIVAVVILMSSVSVNAGGIGGMVLESIENSYNSARNLQEMKKETKDRLKEKAVKFVVFFGGAQGMVKFYNSLDKLFYLKYAWGLAKAYPALSIGAGLFIATELWSFNTQKKTEKPTTK